MNQETFIQATVIADTPEGCAAFSNILAMMMLRAPDAKEWKVNENVWAQRLNKSDYCPMSGNTAPMK